MTVRPEEHGAWAIEPFLCQRHVTNPFISSRPDIEVMLQLVLGREIPQYVDVAPRVRILGKNVMVRQNDQFVGIPHIGVFPELTLEDADRWWTTDIVCHQGVHVYPDVVPGRDSVAPGMLSKNLLGNGLSHNGTTHRTRVARASGQVRRNKGSRCYSLGLPNACMMPEPTNSMDSLSRRNAARELRAFM